MDGNFVGFTSHLAQHPAGQEIAQAVKPGEELMLPKDVCQKYILTSLVLNCFPFIQVKKILSSEMIILMWNNEILKS